MEMDGEETKYRQASQTELWHLAGAFVSRGLKECNAVKEQLVLWEFDPLGFHFQSALGHRDSM